jgi:hypothetical protein
MARTQKAAGPVRDGSNANLFSQVQKSIGKALREQYELPKFLPHKLFALLLQIGKSQGDSDGERG